MEKEKTTITGLDTTENRKEAEYDLVSALLTAAEYKTSEDNITEVDIKRNKQYLFTVRLHPLSQTDARFARKKATTYMTNPNGKKLPPIEKERDEALFASWLIYLATVEEDQKKIWGNPEIMKKFSLNQPVESIDILLTYGEKDKMSDLVGKISGFDDDDDDSDSENMTKEEYAKN